MRGANGTAEVRFDLAFPVSSLQRETPTVGTSLCASMLCKELKDTADYELLFRPVNPFSGGLLVVTDSSLATSPPLARRPQHKVYSQSCYFVLLADEALMRGEKGAFNVLDMRSHRVPRVRRSSYAAETLSKIMGGCQKIGPLKTADKNESSK